jgi:1A family penicillin-binding protein
MAHGPEPGIVGRLCRWASVLVVAGVALGVGCMLLAHEAAIFFTAGTVGSGAEAVELGPLATRSVVYAADGSVIDIFHDEEYRVPVPLDQVPGHVVRAVLDTEDERFYEHGPLDLKAMARAMVTNVQQGEVSEGGSTITQQLVKIVLLTSKQDVNRKIKEAALAIRLENQMTKAQILERYLNTVYFGNHAYGIQAAAERYFQTDVEHLTVPQAALLAGLIRNPVFANPYAKPQVAQDRRNAILDHMVELGHITRAEADAGKAEPMPTPPPPREGPAPGSDYFTEYVKQRLLSDTRLGATDSDRYTAVFHGGLAIHTTLDPKLQQMAEDSVASILPDTQGRFTAALVSVDPTTGAVRALVGGRDFDQTKFNLVTDTAGRQTGSSFKPFTLVAALESGMSPDDTILGTAPCNIPNPGTNPPVWTPDNVEGQGGGTMSLTEATVHSVNCAYARLVKLVGPSKVIDVAHRMGVTNELPNVLSITLGAGGVTPLQMASAYGTLAADGEHHAPYVIDRVLDRDGKEIFKTEPTGNRAISSQNARLVNQVLTQVVQRGTGRAAYVPGWHVAGKTGSTDNNTNAWFIGYTPTLVTAVWMGAPEADISMRNVNGVTVFGGTYPAQIVGSFYRKALAGQTPVEFPAPEGGRGGSRFLGLPGEKPIDESASSTSPGDTAPATPPAGNSDPGPGRGSNGNIPTPVQPTPPAVGGGGGGDRPQLPPEIQALVDRARNRNRPATNGSG